MGESNNPQNMTTVIWVAGAIICILLIICIIIIIRRQSKRDRDETDSNTVITDGPDTSVTEMNDSVITEAISEKTEMTETTELTEKENNSFTLSVGRAQTIGGRQEQQDSFLLSDGAKSGKGVLAAVADGVGGVKGGAVASNAAVVAMKKTFEVTMREKDPADDLLKAAVSAHEAVLSKAKTGEGGYSTLVSVLIRDKKMWLLSIGDSRIALYRSGLLLQLNREHVSARGLMEREYVHHERITEDQLKGRKKLSSYLGVANLQQIDRTLQPMQLRKGDKIVLMSDGVFGTLTEDTLCEELKNNPQEAANNIIERIDAMHSETQDNATIVIFGVM